MGLSVSLSNALSGMNVTQSGLGVLSRNVSNAGTPGYHSQSLNVVDANGNYSTFATIAGVERAFSAALQRQYNDSISSASFASVRQSFLERVESFLGLPGEDGSLDTAYADFENSLRTLATSPDSYAARADVLANAQSLAQTLNSLSTVTQNLRRETETQISEQVANLNGFLTSLEGVNRQLADQGVDDVSRAALSDERDRLVASISEIIDVQADYRPDGTVALMTKSGLGLIDVKASVFEFDAGGNLNAGALFNVDPSENGVGTLTMTGSSGMVVDLVQQNVLRSGSLGALIELRDQTLPQFQAQLDTIAAGLAQSLSSVTQAGATATSGAATGFELDLTDVAAGNSFTLNYVEGGDDKSVRVVRVDDTSQLPIDYVDEDGVRVVGLDFSGGIGGVATDLQALLGAGLAIDNPSGNVLQVLDDGAGATTDISSLTASVTATSNQNGDLGLNLFVDLGNQPFTGSLDGTPQQRGFAARIAVSSDILADNTLLVQYQAGGTLGDAARVDHLVTQLEDSQYTSNSRFLSETGEFNLNGTLSSIISQSLNFQGNAVARAKADADTAEVSLQAIEQRAEDEYGVNIDEEMARLLELQNAYAANARVVSIVQELLQTLMQI